MFDVFYIGENKSLKENIPFARKIESVSEASAKTKMYWVIDPNIEVVDYDILDYRPPDYDQEFLHVWKWNSTNYGGVKLYPKGEIQGIKEINKIACKKTFDILYTVTPEEYFDKNQYATHVWCVDPEYILNDDINWAPDNFEPNYIHCFHLRGQLEHKYPEKEGGIKLYPRDWISADTKYHGFLDASFRYPILYVDDPENYSQRDIYEDDYVWLIDKQYKINEDTVDWTPNPFEDKLIHSFRMPNQLKEKSWSYNHPSECKELGGIRLVPKNWRGAYDLITNGVVIHQDCPVKDVQYDVFYTSKKFTQETFEYYANRAETDYFWVVDRDFEFNGDFLFVPEEHEREYIHVFKVPGFLEYRYLRSVTELWDDRVAGIYLVPKDFDFTKKKLRTFEIPIKYDVFFADDMNNYELYARKSRTDMFWMAGNEQVMSLDITWLPKTEDYAFINIFSDDLKLVPKDYDTNKIRFQGTLSEINAIEFEKFTDEASGRLMTQNDWFWVIDPEVDVLEEFTFSYYPDEWDSGKTHIWQKVNPVTNNQYDYGGVMLCPRVPDNKGRPKYIRERASVQKTFPKLYLSPEKDISSQAREFEEECKTSMYWMIDPFTKIDEDFNFDYYPTQWDIHNVHVFQDQDGAFRNVRLIPNDTFSEKDYTLEEIQHNSFENVKQLVQVASLRSTWPVIELKDFDRDNFVDQLHQHKLAGTPFVWSVDPDVSVEKSVLDAGFLPELTNVNKVHAWQRLNPHNNSVHSYGGLRLWPTSTDYSDLTADTIELNKLRNLQYMKSIGSSYKPYDIIFLSYKEPGAERAYKRLSKRFNVQWVRDVKGIFTAHQKAAETATSKMFWVVDADAEIVDDFNFGYIPDVYDQDVVHVWNSVNPVTGLEYGYGGVKLFNREQVLTATSWGLDFTTGLSNRFKVMPEVSCVTRFNTDAFSTWRSAFRECVKLSLKNDIESKERLKGWLHPVKDADFAHDAKQGAEQGILYAKTNKNNASALANINDFAWLKKYYANRS